MNKLKDVLYGSKQFEFEYGINGMTVLKIQNYNSGEIVKLDLSVLLDYPEVLEEMIEQAEEGEE